MAPLTFTSQLGVAAGTRLGIASHIGRATAARRLIPALLLLALTLGLAPLAVAQPPSPDSDGDGLYDDEVNVYGTDLAVFDTDRGGVGDGEEV